MYVSGPIAAFRLVNKEGHIIYLFGDIHNSLENQKECQISLDSIRIDQLLKRKFKNNPEKKFGFFLETDKNFIQQYNDEYFKEKSLSYMVLLQSFFSDNYSLDDSGKIQKSKHFPNVMFHYVDIRMNVPNKFYYYSINLYLTDMLKSTKETQIIFENYLNEFQKTKDYEKIHSDKYNDKKLKKNILTVEKEILQEILALLTAFDKGIQKCYTYEKKYDKKKYLFSDAVLYKIYLKIERIYIDLHKKTGYTIAMLNDLFLLRRLLDKKFNSSIDYVYTGFFHTLNILCFLLKYTDYSITHSTGDTKFILNNSNNYDAKWYLNNYEILATNILGYNTSFEQTQQCINLEDFPENLS
jgi:hypothetical protein